jgi:hypothetical protein
MVGKRMFALGFVERIWMVVWVGGKEGIALLFEVLVVLTPVVRARKRERLDLGVVLVS